MNKLVIILIIYKKSLSKKIPMNIIDYYKNKKILTKYFKYNNFYLNFYFNNLLNFEKINFITN